MKGVFLDLESVDTGDLDLRVLERSLDDWRMHPQTEKAQLAERITGNDVVVCNKVFLAREIIAQADKLKLIAVAATGTNNIDLGAASDRGITVCNIRDYATPSVAQHVLGLILALTTRLPDYMDAVAKQRWQTHPHFSILDYPIRELHGRTLGIIGFGVLGRAVAQVAKHGLGMEIIIAQRAGTTFTPGRVPLDDLLVQADVISLHCPLTPQTQNLIGAREFTLMKNDALLINTARGGIVDETELVAALKIGQIGGAGIDVLSLEPPRPGNPLLDHDIPNLIVTPHIAWASHDSRQRAVDQVAQNIRAFRDGQPRNVVRQ